MNEIFSKELNNILQEDQIIIKERLSNHTTLHIGGEADYLVIPKTTGEMKDIILLCKKHEIPHFIIGNGSNLLVSDTGYRGLIIKLGDNFSDYQIDDNGRVIAQAGIKLSKLAKMIADQSLTGFEFASGIPGTLGGAVTMNAGAYDGEMKQCIISVKVMDREGNIFELSNKELELGYRSSILQQKPFIILEAELQFVKGEKEQIYKRMQELNTLRREKQPLELPSAGSTFKRPQGYFAGKLISDAGLCGYQVGGAAVSIKHCGFVVNKENATAKDFMSVIEDVKRIVNEKFGVILEPEVKFLGEFK